MENGKSCIGDSKSGNLKLDDPRVRVSRIPGTNSTSAPPYPNLCVPTAPSAPSPI